MARIVVLAAGFMAICALSFSPADAASLAAAPPPSDCSVIVSALMDCFSYVSNDSTTPCPSRSCCAGVADVVTGSPECICQALQEANDLGVAVNMTRALALPAACSVKAPKIHCDASSPSAAPPCNTPTAISRPIAIPAAISSAITNPAAISSSIAAATVAANYTAISTASYSISNTGNSAAEFGCYSTTDSCFSTHVIRCTEARFCCGGHCRPCFCYFLSDSFLLI
ncbi:Protease inhibitor/seed storage/LTP family [Musa troglodytarum]|uniref:Protease inhibitor/seed storage/LTP family n=1 Tax=Musa troglodytarum TaxID=320322 RepID=A0A9E7FYS8_9LILI|nr:Protease inhibitor/seed storage/LTP family [Musa troglodytarum]